MQSEYRQSGIGGESRLHRLVQAGQSVWLDFITRDLLRSGELAQLIDRDCVSGVTSNPAIFQKAIEQGLAYGTSIDEMSRRGMSALQIYEAIAIDDIRNACDLLTPVYERTQALDGYVSLEVDPRLARSASATLSEARRLFSAVARPNLMIKIAATEEALPAITQAVAEGINVNVTLIFSVRRHEQVMNAWLTGLEQAAADRSPKLARTASVASFFISRIDAAVDALLGAEQSALRGQAAIANATAAYGRFLSMCDSERFRALAARGAQVQRPLWASTMPKTAAYRDVVYLEALAAPDTVNTVPPQTLKAFREHGEVRGNIVSAATQADAARVLEGLSSAGIDLNEIAVQLERDGLRLFADAFETLLRTIDGRRTAVR